MARNNMIPNAHFHKKWQSRVKLWFNQPMKKTRRQALRTKKQKMLAPKPAKALRPAVRCPSVRYNRKLRVGRGFTFEELKQTGINKKRAITIGISVDHRRKNRSLEFMSFNVARLKKYQERLIVFSRKEGGVIKSDDGKFLNKIEGANEKIKARKVLEEERKFEAFVTLRKARCDAKYAGVRIKRKLPKCGGP